MKAPKHSMNGKKLTTSRNCISQRKALFYFKVLLGNNFPRFYKCSGKYTSKTIQAVTKPIFK